MNTARKNCIWYDQCGSECQGKCDDYSPADDAGENEVLFYQGVLKENAQGQRLTHTCCGCPGKPRKRD